LNSSFILINYGKSEILISHPHYLPQGKTHYLDAVDTEGQIWFAEMRTDVESWITYSVPWKKAGQQPYNQ
jgi:hypothetical protein